MPRNLTVAILGIPGVGKSTLCRGLATKFGWRYFLLGEALRSRASWDRALAEVLGRGELAPEDVVLDLVRQVASEDRGGVLLLDGFPRHVVQLGIAKDMFRPLVGLLLELPPDVAEARVSARRVCDSCGWSGAIFQENAGACPGCGGTSLHPRPEDGLGVLSGRIGEARRRLQSLLGAWGDTPLLTLDAAMLPDELLRHAEELLVPLGDAAY